MHAPSPRGDDENCGKRHEAVDNRIMFDDRRNPQREVCGNGAKHGSSRGHYAHEQACGRCPTQRP